MVMVKYLKDFLLSDCHIINVKAINSMK